MFVLSLNVSVNSDAKKMIIKVRVYRQNGLQIMLHFLGIRESGAYIDCAYTHLHSISGFSKALLWGANKC